MLQCTTISQCDARDRGGPVVRGHSCRDLVGGDDFLLDAGHRDLPGQRGHPALRQQQRLQVGQRGRVRGGQLHGVGHEPAARHVQRHVVRREHIRDELGAAAHSAGVLLPVVLRRERHQYGGRVQKAALPYATPTLTAPELEITALLSAIRFVFKASNT